MKSKQGITSLCILLSSATLAFAQALPPIAPQTGRANGLTPEISGVLKRMLQAYQTADSYRDAGRLTMIQESGRVRQATKMPSTVDFQRPNLLQVVGGIQTVTCDGSDLQIVLDRLRQFRQQKAPGALHMDHIRMGAPGAGLDQGYPEILEFLLGQNVYNRWISQIDSIRMREDRVLIAGKSCRAIIYQTIHKAVITLYVDAETSLLVRADIDNTDAQRPAVAPGLEGEELPKLNVVLQFDPMQINEPSSSDAFTLRDASAEGMRHVERFEAEAPGDSRPPTPQKEPTHPLVGKPAPSIPGAATKDGPTLYFLWSPNRDAGSLASIKMLERLTDKIRPDELNILGISAESETPGMEAELLKAKKAAFPNVVDTGATLAAAFSIQGLPMFALADADGIVRHVLHGAPEQIESDLADKLETLAARP